MNLIYADYDNSVFTPKVLSKCKKVELLPAIKNHEFYAAIDPDLKHSKWIVFEKSCGSRVGSGKTMKAAIAKAVTVLEKNSPTDEKLAPFVEKFKAQMLAANENFYDLPTNQNTAMAKSKKDNLYKASTKVLSDHTTMAPKKTGKSLDENLKYLRETLSVDPLLDNINQNEALEFLDAVESGLAEEREDYDTLLTVFETATEQLSDFKFLLEKLQELDSEKLDLDALLSFITDEDETLIYEHVKGEGYKYVKINNLADEQKLEHFLTTELYPNYSDQQANLEL